MYYNVKIGSVFMSMNQRIDQSWRRDIITGFRDGTGRRVHIATSGGTTSEFHETWFAHDLDNNVLVRAGGMPINNAPQLLTNCTPRILKEFQHPENPLFWKVGSLDSLFKQQLKS